MKLSLFIWSNCSSRNCKCGHFIILVSYWEWSPNSLKWIFYMQWMLRKIVTKWWHFISRWNKVSNSCIPNYTRTSSKMQNVYHINPRDLESHFRLCFTTRAAIPFIPHIFYTHECEFICMSFVLKNGQPTKLKKWRFHPTYLCSRWCLQWDIQRLDNVWRNLSPPLLWLG